jgi:DNA-directed RNA polymerase specialized sigma24 family protein
MELPEDPRRLEEISTRWTELRRAHQGQDSAARQAQQDLMLRYVGAVYRYLCKAVGNPDVAADLAQDFRHADPERGRFRDYVKAALFHLVQDHHRQQARSFAPLAHDPPAAIAAQELAFSESWRQELLARTWRALADEPDVGRAYHTVLRLRSEHPALKSQALAEQVSVRLGQPCTAAGVRQLLRRARQRFAALLVAETRQSLGPAAEDRLAEELADLQLLKYCAGSA